MSRIQYKSGNGKRIVQIVVLVQLLLMMANPTQASWNERFQNEELPNWTTGAIDWSTEGTTGIIAAMEPNFVFEDEVLVVESDTIRNAHSHLCRTFEGSFETLSFDVKQLKTTNWGVYLGRNFNIYQNMTLDEVTFEGIFVRNRITNEFQGDMTFKIVDYDGSGMTTLPLRETGRDVAGLSVDDMIGSWLTVFLQIDDNTIAITAENHFNTYTYEIENLADVEKFDEICLASYIGGNTYWDNISVRTSKRTLATHPEFFAGIAAIVTTVFGIGFFVVRRRTLRSRSIDALAVKYLSKPMRSHLFGANGRLKPFMKEKIPLLSLLSTKKDNDSNYINEVQNNTPIELLDYKYILHPTRLLILKLLHSEFKISAYSLRSILNLGSGEFSTHKKSLIEHGYVIQETKLTTTGIEQILYLTDSGKEAIRTVLDLLQDLIHDNTPYQFLLEEIGEYNRGVHLYPEEKTGE